MEVNPPPTPAGAAPARRFRIALSFAGEKRDYVAEVARLLADKFGEEAILYDKFHEAEFAVFNLGIRLPLLYGQQSDLIVPIICDKYDDKRWTGWEWVHIYGLLTKADGHRVMPCRFDYANADGLPPIAGYIELDDKTPEQAVKLILQRLAINENQPRDFYVDAEPAAKAAKPTDATNFPAAGVSRNANFVGRTKELADLHAKLAAGDVAVFHAVTADGGFGKSQLAVEYAYARAAEYAGRWFINASTPAAADADGRSILVALGEEPPQESDAVAARVRQRLSDGRHLLILDDAHDLADARRRYALSDPARVLVTTRRRVLARSGSAPFPIDVLSPADALRLLRQGRPDLSAAEHDAPLAAVAERLHRHALAIALARAYLDKYPTVSPAELLRRLAAAPVGADADLLANVAPDEVDPRYRRGVAETLLLHVPTLGEPNDDADERTQTILTAASLIAPRAIPPELLLEAANAAGDDAALDTLVSVSILRYDFAGGSAILTIHGLTQQVVGTRLAATERGRELLSLAADGLRHGLAKSFTSEAVNHPAFWPRLDRLSPHADALLRRVAGKPAHPAWASLLVQFGYFSQLARYRPEDALRCYLEAERIDRAAYGDDHPEVATDINNVGFVLGMMGNLDQAIEEFTEAERIDRGAYGPDHPHVARDLNNIAYVLVKRGDLEQALPKLREAERIDRATFGNDHPDVARDVNNIAALLRRRGRLTEALPKYREAQRILRAAYGDGHPNLAICIFNEAEVLQSLGDVGTARQKYESAFDTLVSLYAERSESVFQTAAKLLEVGGDPVERARSIGGDTLAEALFAVLSVQLAANGRLDLLPPEAR